MKHLFNVQDIQADTTQLYSVKADSKTEAEALFTKSFVPYLQDMSFDVLADSLANGADIVITYLGPVDTVIEMK